MRVSYTEEVSIERNHVSRSCVLEHLETGGLRVGRGRGFGGGLGLGGGGWRGLERGRDNYGDVRVIFVIRALTRTMLS